MSLGGVVESVTGKGAQKESEKASKSARKLSDVQANLAKMNIPYIQELLKFGQPLVGQTVKGAQDAYGRAQQYDPARDTEMAMQAFDAAQRESLERDLGNVNTPYSMRGFTEGNASSDQGGANADLLSRRAFDRGQYQSQLKLGERDKKEAAMTAGMNELTRAFGLTDPTGRTSSTVSSLQGPASTNMNLANMHQNQANQFDVSGLIQAGAGALKGIKFPWQKKKATEWGDSL